MPDKLYSQLIHLVAIAAVSVLLATNHIASQTGMTFLAALVGLALPSPFMVSATTPKAPVT